MFIFSSRLFKLGLAITLTPILLVHANSNHFEFKQTKSKKYGFETVKLGGNMDLLATSKNFGIASEQANLQLREVELSLESQINPWLYGMIFLTKPSDEGFDVEEAAVFAELGYGIRLKAGKYRNEFGILNTIHEPERPQVSTPLPVIEFLGEQQLREPSITIGKKFNLGNGHKGGVSFAILNSKNEIAFNNAQSKDKAYSGKLYYGYKTSSSTYQLGYSIMSGKNDVQGLLSTNIQALDYSYFLQPNYAPTYDYPARFSLLGEVLFNKRDISINTTNKSLGYWTVADYQFMPAHHLGLGLESTENILNSSIKSKAYSVHYSWYYSSHSRFQLEVRRSNIANAASGLEVLLQWNVVLGPHSENPFLNLFS